MSTDEMKKISWYLKKGIEEKVNGNFVKCEPNWMTHELTSSRSVIAKHTICVYTPGIFKLFEWMKYCLMNIQRSLIKK